MAREQAQYPKRAAFSARTGAPGGLASLTVALMLGGCAQGDLLSKPEAQLNPAPAANQATANAGGQTELQKATAYWGQEYAKRPTDLKPALSYARNLKALGEKEKALSVLQQAAVFHDSDPQLASEYGRLALEFDQLSVAARLLEVADSPSNPDWKVISARGTVLAKQGDYKGSIPFYERALTFAPNQPSVLNNLAMAYAMSGEAKKAEEILRQAANEPGSSPKLQQNLALVLGLQGRYDEAKSEGGKTLGNSQAAENADYLKRMVKLEPVRPQPSTAIASASAASDTAISDFKTTVKSATRTAASSNAVASALKPATTDGAQSNENGWDGTVATAAATPNTMLKGSSH